MSDFMVRWLKLSLVALVGCGFVAMVVYALWMRDDLQNSSLEPVLVEASDIPLKRRPDEPGGLEIPHQDKMVFDLLDSPSTAVTAPVDVVEGAVADEDMMADDVVTPPAVIAQVVEEPAKVEPVAVVEPKTEPVVVAKIEPKPEPKPEPKAEPVVAPAAKGGWGVQLASLGSEADAKRAVEQFKNNAGLKNLTPNIASATVKGSTKYRVQFIGLASREAAASLCKSLKISCLPVAP